MDVSDNKMLLDLVPGSYVAILDFDLSLPDDAVRPCPYNSNGASSFPECGFCGF